MPSERDFLEDLESIIQECRVILGPDVLSSGANSRPTTIGYLLNDMEVMINGRKTQITRIIAPGH